VIAGGESALTKAAEASEDSAERVAGTLRREGGQHDVVVGIAASGYTPIPSAPSNTRGTKAGDGRHRVHRNTRWQGRGPAHEVEVGPEVLAGSSRLKAGTAEKLICNMLTTGAMARLGYVYSNLMSICI